MYKLPTPSIIDPQPQGVIRLADNAFIPADERNADWQGYQEWVAGGGKVEKADKPAAPVAAPSLEEQVAVLLEGDATKIAAIRKKVADSKAAKAQAAK